MRQEGITKTAPIHLLLGTHSAEYASSANVATQLARPYLEENEQGVVAIFIESASSSVAQAQAIRMAREAGFYAQLDILVGPRGSELSSSYLKRFFKEEDILWATRGSFIKGQSGFIRAELGEIAALERKYPDRVVMAVEGVPPNIIVPNDPVSELTDKTENFWPLLGRGQLSAASLLHQGLVRKISGTQYTGGRDSSLAESLLLEARVPNTLAVIGHLGALHSLVYHKLKREGLDITRQYPQQVGDSYWYSPMIAAARELIFFPEKTFSKEQWLKNLIQETLYHYLEMRRKQPGILKLLLKRRVNDIVLRSIIPISPLDRQESIEIAYDVTDGFNMDDINYFGDNIKRKSLVQAVADLVVPFLTELNKI